jgi:hypothetical protein
MLLNLFFNLVIVNFTIIKKISQKTEKFTPKNQEYYFEKIKFINKIINTK